MRVLILILLFVLVIFSYGKEPGTPFDYYFEKSSSKYGLNSKLLKAICYAETGLHPYAIAVSRKGKVIKSYFPKSLNEAKAILSRLKTLPGSFNFDVGLCQISRAEMEVLGVPPERLLHPRLNIDFAAYILKKKIIRNGYTWKAVSSYNGSKNYHERIIGILKKWGVIHER